MVAVAYRNLPVNDRAVGGDQTATSSRVDRRAHRELQRAAGQSLLAVLLQQEQLRALSTLSVAGKPVLVAQNRSSPVGVSLSHSGSVVMAGITDLGEIGIDVENRKAKRSVDEIAAFAFGPRERHTVEVEGPAAFYRIWTLREAFSKAQGIGFPILVDGIDYFPEAHGLSTWQATINGRSWFFSTSELPDDYAIAVAIAPRFEGASVRAEELIPRVLL